MDRDSGNETQKPYECSSNYALSKLIVDNGDQDLWRRENPDFSVLTHCRRSSGIRSRMYRVYTDIKFANNTKISKITSSFSDDYNAILLERVLSKTKIGKD